MKDPNDPYTPDLFDAAQRHLGKSPEKSPRQKYYNPCNKRLDDLARLRGCTKRQLVENLLEREWQAAKLAMTQAELPGI